MRNARHSHLCPVAKLDLLAKGQKDLVDIPFTIDIDDFSVLLIVFGDGRGLFLVFSVAGADGLLVAVVGPARRQPPVKQPLRKFLFFYVEGEDEGDGGAFLGQEFIQRLYLGCRPEESVEKEPMRVWIIVERGADNFDDYLIRNQLPLFDDAFCS